MTDDDWRSRYDRQVQETRVSLAALRAGGRQTWRKFRLYELVCGGCGDTLVEIMMTSPWLTMLTRRTTRHPGTPQPDAGMLPHDRAHWSAAHPAVRRDELSFISIRDPRTTPPDADERNTLVPVTCRCRHVDLTEALIFAAVREGKRKAVLPTA